MKIILRVIISTAVVILVFLLYVSTIPESTVEKIGSTPKIYLSDDPNFRLVSKQKSNVNYLYAIRHYKNIKIDDYKKSHPNDIIIQSGSKGEFHYLILSNNLPDPNYIKNWSWKKN